MTITISFTAARELSPEARNGVVTNVLATRVPIADRYVTGACTGGDAFIGRWLYLRYPAAEHYVIIPADRSRVDPWWEDYLPWRPGTAAIGRVGMLPGTTYKDRNARLVSEGTAMFGFPAYPEDDPRSLRSGTWQAIRIARQAGKLCEWHCLSPPYAGRIERPLRDILREAAS